MVWDLSEITQRQVIYNSGFYKWYPWLARVFGYSYIQQHLNFKSCIFMSSSLWGTNFLDPLLGLMLIHTVAVLGQWLRPKAKRRSAPTFPLGFSTPLHPMAAPPNCKHLVCKCVSPSQVSSTHKKAAPSIGPACWGAVGGGVKGSVLSIACSPQAWGLGEGSGVSRVSISRGELQSQAQVQACNPVFLSQYHVYIFQLIFT